jgi:outer membrane protein TolC
MRSVKSYISLLGILAVMAPAGYGQSRNTRAPQLLSEGGFINNITQKYKPQYVPPIDISNSGRLEHLIRAGNLYLSLNDAIALALENNIGLEIQRYTFQTNDIALKSSYTGTNGNWDPIFTSNINWGKTQSIQTNTITSGGQSVNVNGTRQRNFGIQQSFKTGGNVVFGFNNSTRTTNNSNDIFGPNLSSSLQLQGTQPLLNGFGLALNTRGIRIAQNNIRAADFSFKQQINTTLNAVIQAYWNLVSANLNVTVARQSLDLSERLLDQNKKQIEIGTMAPIDIKQTEVQVAQGQQNLITAEAAISTQEITLKNLLSRNGLGSATLAAVHIIPTSRVEVPAVEPVQPIQDLTEMALSSRPELAQQRVQMENTEINLKATRNSMLPTISLTGNLSNPASGGPINPIPQTDPLTGEIRPRNLSSINPDLIGGYSNILRQLWGQQTINYTIGFTLNIPLRNRAAQYTMATQELALRSSQLQLQQQSNTIRADVATAQINIASARARYEVAEKALAAQEAVVDGEQRKFQLGTSTLYVVIQQQNTLATSRQNVVTAQVAYANAKLQMDVATGNLMEKYNIVLDEAKDGTLSRRPDPIPDVINTQNGQAVR